MRKLKYCTTVHFWFLKTTSIGEQIKKITLEKLKKSKYEAFLHPPYSPEIELSCLWKNWLTNCTDILFDSQPAELYLLAIDKLVNIGNKS